MRTLSKESLQLIRSFSPATLRTIAEHAPFPSLFTQLAEALESEDPTTAIHQTLHAHTSLLQNLQAAPLPTFNPEELHRRIQEIVSKQEEAQEKEKEIRTLLEQEPALKSVWEAQGTLKATMMDSAFTEILEQLADGISDPQKHKDLDTDAMLQKVLIKQKEIWSRIDQSLVRLADFTQEKDRADLALQIQYQRVLWHQNHLGADVDTLISLWKDTFSAAVATKDWPSIFQIGQHIKQAALLLEDEPLFESIIHRLSSQAQAVGDQQKQILFLLEWALQKSLRTTKSSAALGEVDALLSQAQRLYLENQAQLPPFIGARILLSAAQVSEKRQDIAQAKQSYKRILRTYKGDGGSFTTYLRAALNLGRIDILENRISLGSERIAYAYQGSKRIGQWPLFSAAIQACLDCAKIQNDTKTQEQLLIEGFRFAKRCYDERFAQQALKYWKQSLSL